MKQLVVKTIAFYQKNISPAAVWLLGGAVGCRFYPSCSEYARQAVKKYGLAKGLARGLVRVAKCNPWSAGGVDAA